MTSCVLSSSVLHPLFQFLFLYFFASLTLPSLHISKCTSLPSSSFSSLSFPLTFDGPRWWLADLHRDVCVERILLDFNQPVGQGADAVLLHCVLCVLYFVESNGEKRWKEREREREREREGRMKKIRHDYIVILSLWDETICLCVIHMLVDVWYTRMVWAAVQRYSVSGTTFLLFRRETGTSIWIWNDNVPIWWPEFELDRDLVQFQHLDLGQCD